MNGHFKMANHFIIYDIRNLQNNDNKNINYLSIINKNN